MIGIPQSPKAEETTTVVVAGAPEQSSELGATSDTEAGQFYDKE